MKTGLKLSQKALILVAVPAMFQLAFLVSLSSLLHQAEVEKDRVNHARELVMHMNKLLRLCMTSVGGFSMHGLLERKEMTRAEANLQELDREIKVIDQLLVDMPHERLQFSLVKSRILKVIDTLDKMRPLLQANDIVTVKHNINNMRSTLQEVYSEAESLIASQQKIEEASAPKLSGQRKIVTQIIWTAAAFNIILAAMLARNFNRTTTERLNILMDNTVRLARRQDLNPALEGNDELAQLDHVFSDMAGALALASRKERLILERLPVGLALLTEAGNIEMLNPTVESMLGVSGQNLIGRDFASLFRTAVKTDAHSFLQDLKEGTTVQSKERVAIKANGELLPVEITLSETGGGGGAEKYIIALIVDLSERHEIERLKQEFVAMVSHDLRTPLTSVQNYLELLDEGIYGQLNESGRQRLPILSNNISHLIKLIRDLIDIHRIESKQLSLNASNVSVASICTHALDSVSAIAGEQQIRILMPDTDAIVFADRDRIVQVLVNLLTNAVKFSPPDTRVTVSVEKEPDWLTIKVSDQGRGIPASHLKSVFERFQQVQSTDANQMGGAGLGLAICKAIVEQHGGRIGVNSEENKGSLFWFKLPAASD